MKIPVTQFSFMKQSLSADTIWTRRQKGLVLSLDHSNIYRQLEMLAKAISKQTIPYAVIPVSVSLGEAAF